MCARYFAQERAQDAWAQQQRVVDQFREAKLHRAADLVEDAVPDVRAYPASPGRSGGGCGATTFGKAAGRRLNKEHRRRTDVVGIFPDRDAVIRLVGAVLAEQHDEWAVSDRRYLLLEAVRAVTGHGPPDAVDVDAAVSSADERPGRGNERHQREEAREH